jgi:hypothetical protein
MQKFLIMTVALFVFTSCKHHKTVMYQAVVGTKTDLFEVVSPTELKLAPGVKSQIVAGPCGPKSGIVFLKNNGGGYMACGCVGAQTSSCTTENDNPEHPSCSGSCTDSEGTPRGCGLFGPIIGPPKDPAREIELRVAFLPSK